MFAIYFAITTNCISFLLYFVANSDFMLYTCFSVILDYLLFLCKVESFWSSAQMDLRDNYWGVLAVKILKLPNGTNSGGLAISGRC